MLPELLSFLKARYGVVNSNKSYKPQKIEVSGRKVTIFNTLLQPLDNNLIAEIKKLLESGQIPLPPGSDPVTIKIDPTTGAMGFVGEEPPNESGDDDEDKFQ